MDENPYEAPKGDVWPWGAPRKKPRIDIPWFWIVLGVIAVVGVGVEIVFQFTRQ